MDFKVQDLNLIQPSKIEGSTIHGTHLSTVENNVYNDIRGSLIYVEDGNEMYNKINYNVGICPWIKDGPKGGCTVPGIFFLLPSCAPLIGKKILKIKSQ